MPAGVAEDGLQHESRAFFLYFFNGGYSVIADSPAMLAGISPAHVRELGVCLFHVWVSPVLSIEEHGLDVQVSVVRRLRVTLGQLVDSMPRTGRYVAAPWFFNQNTP